MKRGKYGLEIGLNSIVYPLEAVFLLVLCAVISGAQDWISITLKGNQGSLRKDVELFFDEHLERGIGGNFTSLLLMVELKTCRNTSAVIGRSKAACTGSWTSHSGKTSVVSEPVMQPQTLPRSNTRQGTVRC